MSERDRGKEGEGGRGGKENERRTEPRMEGGREGEREGGREGGKEGGREGGKRESCINSSTSLHHRLVMCSSLHFSIQT